MKQHAAARKRTWIKIKRGLITDPEHRQRMGECLWLFEYMLDLANWETGRIYGWKDRFAADDMQMPVATVRYQRQKLQKNGYIDSAQEQYGLTIIISRYVNPREHSEQAINIPEGASPPDPPHMGGASEGQGANELSPSAQGDKQDDKQAHRQDDSQGDNGLAPLPLISHITQSPEPEVEAAAAAMFRIWERSAGPLTQGIAADLSDLGSECEVHRKTLPPATYGGGRPGYLWVQDAIVEARRSTKGSFNVKYVSAIIRRWLVEGYGPPDEESAKPTKSAEDHDQWLEQQRKTARKAIREAKKKRR